MQRKMGSVIAAALLAASAMPPVGGGVEVIPRDSGRHAPKLDSRRSAFRQGRRFRNGKRISARGGNPAGTKIARKIEKGALTIVGIR